MRLVAVVLAVVLAALLSVLAVRAEEGKRDDPTPIARPQATPVPLAADLTLSLFPYIPTARPGDRLNYVFRVENRGTLTAREVTVIVVWPVEINVGAPLLNGAWDCSVVDATRRPKLVCSMAWFPPGEQWLVVPVSVVPVSVGTVAAVRGGVLAASPEGFWLNNWLDAALYIGE